MIPNPPNSTGYWLFPSAFNFILERQLDNGGWSSVEASMRDRSWDVDRILNTIAALLALLTRRSSEVEVPDDIEERIARANTTLCAMLQSWDAGSSDNIGFEVLIPAHLDMLEKYDLRYQFPARPHLMALHEQNMRLAKPESLYGKEPSTLLYSLEGMIGKIDFDRISQHKNQGSMLFSPSSTAAYLMSTTCWDAEAETYLRNCMQYQGVPEVYPTNIFEITWDMTPHYALMMVTQTFAMLLRRWEQGLLPGIPKLLLTEKIRPVVFGIAVEILQRQLEDGSWGFHSRETTAYAMHCLAAAAPLPLCQCLRKETERAISDGKAFLLQQMQDWAKPDLVRTSKVTYGLGVIAEALTLAAMRHAD
ncbi:MAG: hypothetical protein Q9198_000378 [Flavoplaca austrocitrina]